MEEESQEETSILHSSGIYNMKNNINSTLIAYSSFPWEEFSGDMKILENEVWNRNILSGMHKNFVNITLPLIGLPAIFWTWIGSDLRLVISQTCKFPFSPEK